MPGAMELHCIHPITHFAHLYVKIVSPLFFKIKFVKKIVLLFQLLIISTDKGEISLQLES